MNWIALRERLLGESIKETRPPKLSIPALPAVAMEFCRAADNPSLSVGDLANILDRDAAMVVDLLRNVNSSSSGTRNKVTSSRSALALLGARRAKMFVLTSSVQSVTQKSKSNFASVDRFSFVSMQRAVFARRLADRLGYDSELCFAAALLQDFTVPALTAERPERYKAMLEMLVDDVPSIAQLETARFGWDHALAGARLMMSWQFPEELICLQYTHHWLDPILATPTFSDCEMTVVALSALLPDALDARPARTALLEQHLTSRYGIEIESFQKWVSEDLQYTGVATDAALAWKAPEKNSARSTAMPRNLAVGAGR